ncbi:MAG: DUF1648 domain-containing protein [Mobilitalea sp.]
MKFKYTKYQIIMEIAALLLILGEIIFVCVQWRLLPEKIPGHFNALGEIDRWGSKKEIIILPIIGGFLYIMLTVFAFLPKTWSLPVKITKENKEVLYRYARGLLISVKAESIGMFFYMTYNITKSQPLSGWFLPVFLFVIFGTIIYYMKKFSKEEKKWRKYRY